MTWDGLVLFGSRLHEERMKMKLKETILNRLQLKQRDIDEVLDNISSKFEQIKKEILELNIEIRKFTKKCNSIEKNLAEIRKNWLRKVANSRFLIEDIEAKVNRMEVLIKTHKETSENLYLDQIKFEFETINSSIPVYNLNIDDMSFDDAGLSIMGIILAFFPIIHILCLPIGIFLFFRADFRSKIAGFSVLLIAMINLLYYVLVTFFII